MIRRLTIAVCLGAAPLAAAPVLAGPVPMSGSEIQAIVAGATLEIDAGFGVRVPIRLGTDGSAAGEASGLSWILGAASDRGRWWTDGDRLCHQWSKWFSGEPHCLRMRRDGDVLRWQSDSGRTGTATVIVPPPARVATVPAPRPAPPAEGRQPRPADGASAIAPLLPSPPASAPPAVPAPAPVALGTMSLGALVPPKPVPIPVPVRPAAKPVERPTRSVAISAAPPVTARPLFEVVNVRADDVLNVRAGPSAEHEIVGHVPPDSRDVEVTGACLALWCPVVHRGASGWVNRLYLVSREVETGDAPPSRSSATAQRDMPDAPRRCLSAPARALLARIEARFGPVRVISTCRPGAVIAGTGRLSRHASGNAVDFDAGARKGEILSWLIDNHRDGGTMTYPNMDHIHVDIGPHFVSIAGGMRWASWRDGRPGY